MLTDGDMLSKTTLELVELALKEDIGAGDVTSQAIIDPHAEAHAAIIAQEHCIMCGHDVAKLILERLDQSGTYTVLIADGSRAAPGDKVALVEGKVAALLSGERTMLNFLQRLSGIATRTERICALVKDLPVRILDTRKTIPGWRELEKYAVRTGGGFNHRSGLYDAVLIKNNHVDAVGGDIVRAVSLARAKNTPGMKIEVEVRNFAELELAVKADPDAVLLDNMKPELLEQAVNYVREKSRKHIELEASGGIDESDLREYAKTGVDSISLGTLTHSVRAVSLALRYQSDGRALK